MDEEPTKKRRTSCWKWLFVALLVLLVRIIDFLAILECPDIVKPVDVSRQINKTLIMMIETRTPPPKTACINRHYAELHNYDFEIVTHHWCFDKYKNRFDTRVHLWCRPLIFRDALKVYQSIFYLDSDAFFCRPSTSIENFFDYARNNQHFLLGSGQTTFVGAEDCGTYLTNGGIQFWRKTPYTDFMLTTWFLLYRRQYILYWLRIHWLPSYEIHYFFNREQGSFKVAVDENDIIRNQVSIIRYGPDTWHLPYRDKDCKPRRQWTNGTFYLNHITSNFGIASRNLVVQQHIEKYGLLCN